MTKFITITGGIPHLQTISSAAIYDEGVDISTTITSGTAVTLPSSKTYNSADLIVILNGQTLESSLDYNYVGTVPRTQVNFTFDLFAGDRVRFRIE